jgi:hypothetical protein
MYPPSCHNGMVWSAKWFFVNVKPLLLHLLRHHPGYGLTIVGHSLGAGVACCLTMLLNKERASWGDLAAVSLQCIAFATPACASLELCRLSQSAGNIISVVNFYDCVPRMSAAATKVCRPGCASSTDPHSCTLPGHVAIVLPCLHLCMNAGFSVSSCGWLFALGCVFEV